MFVCATPRGNNYVGFYAYGMSPLWAVSGDGFSRSLEFQRTIGCGRLNLPSTCISQKGVSPHPIVVLKAAGYCMVAPIGVVIQQGCSNLLTLSDMPDRDCLLYLPLCTAMYLDTVEAHCCVGVLVIHRWLLGES